jgi:FtsH-binding integral membrane protein
MAQATAKALPVAKPIAFNRVLALVYLVMALGLAITAVVSSSVSTNPEFMKRILYNPWFAFGLFLIQIFVVVAISGAVMRLSPGVAFLLFLLYSALTGLAISAIFIYYSNSTIAYTFWVTAGMFLFASVIGLVIRRDLSGLGMFLLLALAGWMFGLFLTWFFPFARRPGTLPRLHQLVPPTAAHFEKIVCGCFSPQHLLKPELWENHGMLMRVSTAGR